MAMFQQYQNGVTPVTGMAEAGANIGNMYAQGINNLTRGLAEGIKAYNDNSAKNELANQKIQSLSQDVANKIAMYSQDPEIAQSGVLEGLMQTAATLQDAPTKEKKSVRTQISCVFLFTQERSSVRVMEEWLPPTTKLLPSA
jgi:hypothetical protein